MVDHHYLEQRNQSPTAETLQPKFITAAQVSAATNAIPEISDEELLAMALEFEKEHGQK